MFDLFVLGIMVTLGGQLGSRYSVVEKLLLLSAMFSTTINLVTELFQI